MKMINEIMLVVPLHAVIVTGALPTSVPTSAPSKKSPTVQPSSHPTTRSPTQAPSKNPTSRPTSSPSRSPSLRPSPAPTTTSMPSNKPSPAPSSLERVLRDIIRSASPASEALIDVDGSPQSRSFHWLFENTALSEHDENCILQRYAMATFYESTDGAGWTSSSGWLTDSDECSWMGVVCDTPSGMLKQLQLPANNLRGAVPLEVGLMSSLEWLELSRNAQLRGSIPVEMGDLSVLKYLDLDNTGITEGLPTQLGQIASLERLDVAGTPVVGEVPTELGNLQNLDSLLLANSAMTGEMPSEVCDIVGLTEVSWNCEPLNPCECCTFCCYVQFSYCAPV